MKAQKAVKLSEAQWQAQVVQMARTFGWMVAHFRPALNQRGKWQTAVAADGAGFPDLVLVHAKTGDLLFVELKSDSGVLSAAQQRWLLALEPNPLGEERDLRARVWRPSDFPKVRERLMRPHTGPRRGDDARP